MSKIQCIIKLACINMAFVGLSFWSSAFAATCAATSPNRADVLAAYNSCTSVGDTITIPAGSSTTWTSAITITRGIKVIGAGPTKTTITGSGFNINLTVDNLVQISGIAFKAASKGVGIGIMITNGTVHPDQLRFFDVSFTNYEFGIWNEGGHGVVHNATFTNNDHDFRCKGYLSGDLSRHSPSPPWLYNSLHQWVIEDSTFNFTGSGSIRADTEYPATFIIRYSTFNISNDDYPQPVDMHGSAGTANNQQGVRMYNNTFNLNVDGRCADLRGGMNHLFYNNTLTGPGDCAVEFSANPSGSQVATNNFVWNNTPSNRWSVGRVNGASYTPAAPGNFSELAYPHPFRSGSGGSGTTPPPAPQNLRFGP